MDVKLLVNKLVIGMLSFLACILVYAGSPVWTFTAMTPNVLKIPPQGQDLVQYKVHNQSIKPKNLVLIPITGVTQNGVCRLAPKVHVCLI